MGSALRPAAPARKSRPAAAAPIAERRCRRSRSQTAGQSVSPPRGSRECFPDSVFNFRRITHMSETNVREMLGSERRGAPRDAGSGSRPARRITGSTPWSAPCEADTSGA